MKSKSKAPLTSLRLSPEDTELLNVMAMNLARTKVQIMTAALRLLKSMTSDRNKFGELVLDLLNEDRKNVAK